MRELPNDAEVHAAARVLDEVGRHHGWWSPSDKPYTDLDPIGLSEFLGIVLEMLVAAENAKNAEVKPV